MHAQHAGLGSEREACVRLLCEADDDGSIRTTRETTAGDAYGEIVVDGERRRVVFEPITDEHTNDAIDEAYRAKHGASQYLAPMISKRARAATVRVRPSTAPA